LKVASIRKATLIKVLKQCPQLRLLHLESLPYDLSQEEVGRLLISRSAGGALLKLGLQLEKVTRTELQYLSRVGGIAELSLCFADNIVSPALVETLQACLQRNRSILRCLTLRNCGAHVDHFLALLKGLPQLIHAKVAKGYGKRVDSKVRMTTAAHSLLKRERVRDAHGCCRWNWNWVSNSRQTSLLGWLPSATI
jgi:hypothetical protein